MWQLTLPLYLVIPKKRVDDKIFALNMNVYRNAHFYTLNDTKKLFKELVKKQIESLPVFSVCQLSYSFFPARKSDNMNFASIVDKYFSDALVELGKLPDDNCEVITEHHIKFCGYDKTNPRMEVTITGIIKDNNMKIILTQEDITTAIHNYVNSTMNVNDHCEMTVVMEGKYEFYVNVVPSATGSSTKASSVPSTGTRRGRPPKSASESETSPTMAPMPSEQKPMEPEEEDMTPSFSGSEDTEETPAAVQPKRSLFGNMTKPVNH